MFRSLGWIILGISIAVIYTSFVVACTYYSPGGIILVVALAILIITLGIAEPLLERSGKDFPATAPIKSAVIWSDRHFTAIFSIALLTVVTDIILTLIALSIFGLEIERNQAVAALLREGSIPIWLGLQLAPLWFAGSAYLILRKPSVRAAISFYVLATAVYATYVAINNVIVLGSLLSPR